MTFNELFCLNLDWISKTYICVLTDGLLLARTYEDISRLYGNREVSAFSSESVILTGRNVK